MPDDRRPDVDAWNTRSPKEEKSQMKRAGTLMWRSSCLAIALWMAGSGAGFAQDSLLATKLHLGAEAMRNHEPETAAAYFAEATKLAPNVAEVWMNLALAYEQQGKAQAEIQALQTALKLKPTLRGANLFLGIAWYKLDNFSKATAALNREAGLNPKDAKALMWLGVTKLAAGDLGGASRALDKAAELAPEDVDILYHRGRAHLRLSQESYEKMYQVAPQSWRVHQVLAQAYAQADRQTQAITEYEQAIKLVPEEPGLNVELGDQYKDAGVPDKAEAAYMAELKIDPGSVLALFKLGSLRVDHANPQGALPVLQQAFALAPELPDTNYYLGKAYAQLGQSDEAVASLKRAIVANPQDDTLQRAYYQLALVYRRMHRTEESKAALANFEKLKQQADAQQKQKFQNQLKKHDEPAVDDESAAPAADKQDEKPQ